MKQIIFRVDDRLIHGQVVEGWIKKFQIQTVIIANNRIYGDAMQQLIYQNVVPSQTVVSFYPLDNLIREWTKIRDTKTSLLVLFESVSDLIHCEQILNRDIYINIGCIACRTHIVELSDTVFLDHDELKKLTELASKWDIHIKKLPWEKDASIGEAKNCDCSGS